MRAEGFVSIRVAVPDVALGERVIAEAFAAGAAGLVEGDDGCTLEVYAADGRAHAVRGALEPFGAEGLRWISGTERVIERDWATAWREGLRAIRVSERLVVRPSFAESLHAASGEALPGVVELVVEPGQAFGTGGHASTRLALALLDEALARRPREWVLDVGTGSGVLALAALRLGASRAIGFDLDPLAALAARDNAAANGLAAGLRLFTGTFAALAGTPGRFDLIVANMIRSELEPCLAAIAGRLAPAGAAIFSGLLAHERERFSTQLGRLGLRVVHSADELDDTGDHWLAVEARNEEDGA